MKIGLSDSADRQYDSLTKPLRKAFDKQVIFLSKNIRHPSLHAKKYDEATNLWQARVTKDWRFYFLIAKDLYYIVSIRKHPK